MSDETRSSRRQFISYVLAATVIVFLAVVIYSTARYAANLIVIVFAGVLLGVVLSTLSRLIEKHTFLNYRWSVVVLLTAIVLAGAGVMTFFGAQLAGQFDELYERLPQVWSDIKEQLTEYGWGQDLINQFAVAETDSVKASDLFLRLTGWFSTAFGALTNMVVMVFVGLFVAFSPWLYSEGVIALVPQEKTDRAREVMHALGHALNRWMLGRIISMALIAVLLALGLQLLGLPFAISLGLLAGLLTFVPYIGALLGVVPAVLIAFSVNPTMVLWVLGIYFAAQILESYVITPVVQQEVVALAPAVLIVSQLIFGALAGAWGVAFASPIAVCAIVLVQMLYVDDVLGKDVSVIGSGSD